jgi:phosphoribosyl 1,2-cyclic phosphodiesterase
MSPPFFPVGMEAMASGKQFHQLDAPLELRGLKLSFKKMNHPGACYSYLVEEGGRRFRYATDTERSADDFARTEENARFFKDADLAVIDAQYTLEEAINKYNWGHNAFSMAVDFAANWKIRRLVLFHHEPAYDDKKLYAIFRAAREYQKKMSIGDLEITLALEGLEIAL